MTGAITTPHPMATEAGAAVLRAGGTAPEALIAAGAVLTVVMPHFCGLGGDAVWLLADRQGRQKTLLAIGQGLENAAPIGPIPLRGPQSVLTTAGVVAGWHHALCLSHREMGGRARWGDLLAPSINFAEDGFTVTSSQEFWSRFREAESVDWPGFASVFLGPGGHPAAGHILRQPDLARSLRDLAERGAEDFYLGALSRRIVDGLQAQGVPMSSDDLARTTCRERRPIALGYRGLTLLAPPPPTQGVTTLQIMGQLAQFDLAAMEPGSAGHIHLCVEAVKRAFLQRGLISDPAFRAFDNIGSLEPSHLAGMAADIMPQKAMAWPHVWQHGDTVFLGAMDEMGNAVSVLQSIYFDWGSGVVAGDTGILWQNRGAAFHYDADHINSFAPGKLPFYTLNPGIALRDGKPYLAYGTQGADGQPQTLAMLLTRLIDYGQSPDVALAAPRFLLGRTFSDSRDSLKLEEDIGSEVGDELLARGHETCLVPAQSPISGQAGVVRFSEYGFEAWHDPRR
ncbi:MAG: gamma-glutamyltransferase [Loktanella sp.]|nr:gamma-glutamyltransferase [Loktanella sp.]